MSAPQPRDIDEIAVERACHGDRTVSLNRSEMEEAFCWLTAHGYSGVRTAQILGVSERTVFRWRRGAQPRRRQMALA